MCTCSIHAWFWKIFKIISDIIASIGLPMSPTAPRQIASTKALPAGAHPSQPAMAPLYSMESYGTL